MKKLLAAMFVALLMVGCETAEVGGGDLDDPETRKRIIAEAIDSKKLEWRGKKGEELRYAPDQNTPYTGWKKKMRKNGQIEHLAQYKDGKLHGLITGWYENGQKQSEGSYKDGKAFGVGRSYYENGTTASEENYKDDKMMTAVVWKPSGEKCPVTNVKDGNGVGVSYYENGQKKYECTYKDGKLWTAVHWKPNGEKCPVTNVKDGKGVVVYYNDDGTELGRLIFPR